MKGIGGRGIRTLRAMHAFDVVVDRRRAFLTQVEHPFREGRGAHAPARGNIGPHPFRDAAPSGCLPDLKGTVIPAKAPAHRKIQVAGIVSNFAEMEGAIVEYVAKDGPEELRVRI